MTHLIVPPAIKICGLKRRGDAEMVVREGADFLGVVLVPGTPRALSPEEAREVVSGLGVPVVMVVADLELARIVDAAGLIGAGIIQLHGEEPPRQVAELKERGPWEVWKALRVRIGEDARRGIEAFSGVADGILLDGWHPVQKGGSGTAFSWEDVATVRGSFPEGIRLVAAGGLNPENVEEAIRRLEPHVVDVSSGVEDRAGIKSSEKVRAFIRNARRVGKGGRR